MNQIDALRAAYAKAAKDLVENTRDSILEEAEVIKEQSMANTPVDHGVLKASHEVLPPVYDGSNWKVTIQVGGAAEAYAMAVHEHLSEHSPPSWIKAEAAGHPVHFTTGGPKFLENAVRAAIPGFRGRVMARVAAKTKLAV